MIVIMTNTITIIIIGVSIVSIKTIANITTIFFPPEQTPHPGHPLDNARQLGIQQIVRNVQPEMKMQSIWCRNKCDRCPKVRVNSNQRTWSAYSLQMWSLWLFIVKGAKG